MSQELDLTNLRKIAEAEPTHKWGAWDFEEDDWDGHAVFISDNGPGVSYVAEKITQGEDEGESTARFIATFDPPTVLALLSRLEQAEQAVARVRDVIKRAPTVDPLRGFAGPPDDWPDDTHFTSYGEWIMANRVREALDGDTRRLADQGLGDNLARTTKNGDNK